MQRTSASEIANVRGVRSTAVWLISITVVYNVGEGVVSIWSGWTAGSLTLLAFGADSYLEVLAAGAVLWRLSFRDEELGERAETRAMRLIGSTFLILAVAIVFESAAALSRHEGADRSLPGLVVLVVSATVMPAVALGKLWAAARLDLPIVAVEAKETIACSYLTLTALAGIAAVFLFGSWWLDAAAALLMVPWLAKEGREGLSNDRDADGGRPCFCRSCLFGIRACAGACCDPRCCAAEIA
jgi:divalent metal cation (Fe/Co/Zn/Cd) transporter